MFWFGVLATFSANEDTLKFDQLLELAALAVFFSEKKAIEEICGNPRDVAVFRC